jgi:hypothetical protein
LVWKNQAIGHQCTQIGVDEIIYFKDTLCQGIEWIELAQERVEWRVLMGTVVSFRVLKSLEVSWPGRYFSISRNILYHRFIVTCKVPSVMAQLNASARWALPTRRVQDALLPGHLQVVLAGLADPSQVILALCCYHAGHFVSNETTPRVSRFGKIQWSIHRVMKWV